VAVPFKYVQPPTSGELRQGEILADVFEYKPKDPVDCRAARTSIEVEPISHAYAIVVTQDCDLLSDFTRRSSKELEHPNILHHLLLCDMFKEEEIRSRLPQGSDIWKRVKQNQDERYHCVVAGPIGDEICEDCGPGDRPVNYTLPPLYLDFKRVLSIPTGDLYRALETGEARRIALLPLHYLFDLNHRFYSFLSPIGLPI
jgi:hypothetical protein